MLEIDGSLNSNFRLPSHAASSHDELCEVSPEQGNPVPEGSGEVQVLVRDFVPGPHSAEHSVQSPHSDHPPSTPVSGDSLNYEVIAVKIYTKFVVFFS